MMEIIKSYLTKKECEYINVEDRILIFFDIYIKSDPYGVID
ncbi:hypothetical protein ACNSOL_00330 [Aliarcobacter lanthieri]